MFLELGHTKLDIYSKSKMLTLLCYKATIKFPQEEKYNLVQQIRRAALSVHLNIAEGASRKSPLERKRFYEIARSSVVEVDTGFDIGAELKYCEKAELTELGYYIISCFKQLSSLINYNTDKH